jgi:hypothetical protein
MAKTTDRPTTTTGTPPARTNGTRMLRRYGPFGLIVVIVAVVALVTVVFGGGDDDDAGSGGEVKSEEQLIRSGPMTPDKAELLGRNVDFGPTCDEQRGRVAIPIIYSPPCVAPFEGDNGGATGQGVTGDTIKVVVYSADPARDPLLATQVATAGGDVSQETAQATTRGYLEVYEQYFETYGRKVEFEFFTGTGAFNDAAAATADAISIAEKKPFAVLNAPPQVTREFAVELASRGILCLGRCALALPENFTKEFLPYTWGNGPSPEQSSRLAAEAIGTQGGPGKAEFAGDPELQDKERVYGLVHFETPDGRYKDTMKVFKGALKEQGIEIEGDVPFFLDLARQQENARTIITKLKDAGVTSVIFYGDPLTPAAMTKEATAQEYFPEWFLGPSVLADTTFFGRTYDQEQWQNGFGISLPPARGEEETRNSFHIYQWFHATAPPDNTYAVLWPEVNLLMTGIHLAGPELTPEAFRDGLFRYPPTGGGPTNAHTSRGDRDFWPYTDYWGTDDAALIWWDPTAEGETENGIAGVGMYRYANQGKRYKLGEFPSKNEGGLFDVENSVTVFPQLPREDVPPDYPSPAG